MPAKMELVSANAKINEVDLASLQVVHYPDPALREVSTPVDDPADPAVRRLADRMFELMFAAGGVGLAAVQVGVTVRLFVASPGFEADDRRVYVNPEIVSADDSQEDEEGCLSFPSIFCRVKRHKTVTIRAYDLEGKQFEQVGGELTARIFEHEIEHLEGRLLVDRMGTVAKMANRRALKELQERFEKTGA